MSFWFLSSRIINYSFIYPCYAPCYDSYSLVGVRAVTTETISNKWVPIMYKGISPKSLTASKDATSPGWSRSGSTERQTVVAGIRGPHSHGT